MSLLKNEGKLGKSKSMTNEILKFVFKDRYTYVWNTL